MNDSELLNEAKRLFKLRKYKAAIEKLEKLKNCDTKSKIEILYYLGCCYLYDGANSLNSKDKENSFIKSLNYFEDVINHVSDENSSDKLNKLKIQALCHAGDMKWEQSKTRGTIFQEGEKIYEDYFQKAKSINIGNPIGIQKWIDIIKYFDNDLLFIKKTNQKAKIKEYKEYFNFKRDFILNTALEKLKVDTPETDKIKETIASILAILAISPIECTKPLAHYTTPYVCGKLLGIEKKSDGQFEDASKMRMNSSTYMNDPSEGKSLLNFLGIEENILENKTDFRPNNAFFTCFTTRVNDLNQFRLYGKVKHIEASGCCLVFNKNKNWILEPDFVFSEDLNDKQEPEKKLPLYQVAYIFYKDEYIEQDEYDIFKKEKERFLRNKSSASTSKRIPLGVRFGVCLKPISDNLAWHKMREEQLRCALKKLFDYFKKHQQTDQSVLEYIRYLFKDYAFRDEEEFRLLRIEELGSDKVKYCPETNSAYVEYADICYKLDEVILGTNYERAGGEQKVEAFRYLLKQKLPHIKVSHSSLPINAALPVRKP